MSTRALRTYILSLAWLCLGPWPPGWNQLGLDLISLTWGLRSYTDQGPAFAAEGFGEFHHVSDADTRKMRRGYFAATSFTDAQMGKVLDSLAAAGEPTASNTVTLLWSDHVRIPRPRLLPRGS